MIKLEGKETVMGTGGKTEPGSNVDSPELELQGEGNCYSIRPL